MIFAELKEGDIFYFLEEMDYWGMGVIQGPWKKVDQFNFTQLNFYDGEVPIKRTPSVKVEVVSLNTNIGELS